MMLRMMMMVTSHLVLMALLFLMSAISLTLVTASSTAARRDPGLDSPHPAGTCGGTLDSPP